MEQSYTGGRHNGIGVPNEGQVVSAGRRAGTLRPPGDGPAAPGYSGQQGAASGGGVDPNAPRFGRRASPGGTPSGSGMEYEPQRVVAVPSGMPTRSAAGPASGSQGIPRPTGGIPRPGGVPSGPPPGAASSGYGQASSGYGQASSGYGQASSGYGRPGSGRNAGPGRPSGTGAPPQRPMMAGAPAGQLAGGAPNTGPAPGQRQGGPLPGGPGGPRPAPMNGPGLGPGPGPGAAGGRPAPLQGPGPGAPGLRPVPVQGGPGAPGPRPAPMGGAPQYGGAPAGGMASRPMGQPGQAGPSMGGGAGQVGAGSGGGMVSKLSGLARLKEASTARLQARVPSAKGSQSENMYVPSAMTQASPNRAIRPGSGQHQNYEASTSAAAAAAPGGGNRSAALAALAARKGAGAAAAMTDPHGAGSAPQAGGFRPTHSVRPPWQTEDDRPERPPEPPAPPPKKAPPTKKAPPAWNGVLDEGPQGYDTHQQGPPMRQAPPQAAQRQAPPPQAAQRQAPPPQAPAARAPPPARGGFSQRAPPPPMPPSEPDFDPRPAVAAFGGNGGLPDEAMDPDIGPMVQCHSCGRKFREEAYSKHARICEKVFINKRKAYNSTAARVEGTEASKYVDVKKGQPKAGTVGAQVAAKIAQATGQAPPAASRGGGGGFSHENKALPGSKLPKWKAQSEQLRRAMIANKKIQDAQAAGVDIRTLDFGPTEEEHDDRVPCPHCGRRFAPLTAERHIPKCKDTAAKPSRLNAHAGKGAHARR